MAILVLMLIEEREMILRVPVIITHFRILSEINMFWLFHLFQVELCDVYLAKLQIHVNKTILWCCLFNSKSQRN